MPVSSEVSTGRHAAVNKVLVNRQVNKRTRFWRSKMQPTSGCNLDHIEPPPGGRSEVCATCAGNRSVLASHTPANWRKRAGHQSWRNRVVIAVDAGIGAQTVTRLSPAQTRKKHLQRGVL